MYRAPDSVKNALNAIPNATCLTFWPLKQLVGSTLRRWPSGCTSSLLPNPSLPHAPLPNIHTFVCSFKIKQSLCGVVVSVLCVWCVWGVLCCVLCRFCVYGGMCDGVTCTGGVSSGVTYTSLRVDTGRVYPPRSDLSDDSWRSSSRIRNGHYGGLGHTRIQHLSPEVHLASLGEGQGVVPSTAHLHDVAVDYSSFGHLLGPVLLRTARKAKLPIFSKIPTVLCIWG